jgi:hypothetical protein
MTGTWKDTLPEPCMRILRIFRKNRRILHLVEGIHYRYQTFYGSLGVWHYSTSDVIVYDDKTEQMPQLALWWMLRALGHQHIRVVDGARMPWFVKACQCHRQENVCRCKSLSQQHGYTNCLDGRRQLPPQILMLLWSTSRSRPIPWRRTIDLIAGHIPVQLIFLSQ